MTASVRVIIHRDGDDGGLSAYLLHFQFPLEGIGCPDRGYKRGSIVTIRYPICTQIAIPLACFHHPKSYAIQYTAPSI